jgi:hypothetical protein
MKKAIEILDFGNQNIQQRILSHAKPIFRQNPLTKRY